MRLTRTNRNKREWILALAAVLMFVAGVAKLATSAGSARILDTFDPVLIVRYRWLFLAVGLIETATAIILLDDRCSVFVRAGILLYSGSVFALYHLVLRVINPGAHCKCLGTFAEWLPVSSEMVSGIIYALIAYFIVSGVCLFWLPAQK